MILKVVVLDQLPQHYLGIVKMQVIGPHSIPTVSEILGIEFSKLFYQALPVLLMQAQV